MIGESVVAVLDKFGAEGDISEEKSTIRVCTLFFIPRLGSVSTVSGYYSFSSTSFH